MAQHTSLSASSGLSPFVRPKETPDNSKIDEHLVSLISPSSFEAEQYRSLCHYLEQKRAAGGLSVLAVSSPGVGDGKTTTAINIAGTLAQLAPSRVLLMDCDLRRPTVAAKLGFPATLVGLSDLLSDSTVTPSSIIRRLAPFSMSIVLSGHCPDDPYRMLLSKRFGEILQLARQHYDWIILDAPPLLAVPDCRAIERWADYFLFVVGADRTPRRLIEQALNMVPQEKNLGIILNGEKRPLSGYYKYYRDHGYGGKKGKRNGAKAN